MNVVGLNGKELFEFRPERDVLPFRLHHWIAADWTRTYHAAILGLELLSQALGNHLSIDAVPYPRVL